MSVDVSGTPSVDLVGELDQQVRSVVRREGVDPQLDAGSAASPRRSSAPTTSAA